MRGYSDVVRSESSVESQCSFIPNDFTSTVQKSFIGNLTSLGVSLLFPESGFDKIKRQGKEAGEEASNGRSG